MRRRCCSLCVAGNDRPCFPSPGSAADSMRCVYPPQSERIRTRTLIRAQVPDRSSCQSTIVRSRWSARRGLVGNRQCTVPAPDARYAAATDRTRSTPALPPRSCHVGARVEGREEISRAPVGDRVDFVVEDPLLHAGQEVVGAQDEASQKRVLQRVTRPRSIVQRDAAIPRPTLSMTHRPELPHEKGRCHARPCNEAGREVSVGSPRDAARRIPPSGRSRARRPSSR